MYTHIMYITVQQQISFGHIRSVIDADVIVYILSILADICKLKFAKNVFYTPVLGKT